MRQHIPALLAAVSVAFASQTAFSVHDDLLAFPQYDVIFSDVFITDTEASLILDSSSPATSSAPQNSNIKSLQSPPNAQSPPTSNAEHVFDPSLETYELMFLNGEQHLCTIPIVEVPPRNETSEAEAKVAEQKELARATDRGWELLQDLEGNCLYFVSGWWSYSFCYNNQITQFHQLPPQPGKPPQPDPLTQEYVLGRVRGRPARGDEWGTDIDLHKGKKFEPPKTELQTKGDTRYLVQKMEGGTTCDLTGKPRRIEIQYHCNPQLSDRIGYIKEVTTCSYVMVVYTPRLCKDVAFLPPKGDKAHPITCRVVIAEDDLSYRNALRTLESKLESTKDKDTRPQIGGLIVGEGRWMNKEGARMPIPSSFGKETTGRASEVIVRGKSKAEGGKVETLSDAELLKMDVNPVEIEALREEMQNLAQGNSWRIEVVDVPGGMREILGIMDDPEEQEGEGPREVEGGSQEIYKDEL